MTHPLVDQLRFARSEFRRGVEGITDAEARQRFLPMNCISWNIGHLAWQEQRYWLKCAQDALLLPEVQRECRSGAPASSPPLAEVWGAWEAITATADPWLERVTGESLAAPMPRIGRETEVSVGTQLLRMIYHYWYHTGENAAIRQQLGHADLPPFVGNLDAEAPYRVEVGVRRD
jgi:hypothetical protein